MTTTIRSAATVVLLRESGAGPEVFLLQRNHESVFVPSAHLFPGGAIDPEDADAGVAARSTLSPERAAELLGTQAALMYWIGAIRETFEEAGVLLATRADGSRIDLDDEAIAARFARHRRDVDLGRRPFADVCEEEDLLLDTAAMVPIARWITPVGAPRRYDTRFFVTRMPDDQHASHDDVEAIASTWARPSRALELERSGHWTMIEPTVHTLEALAGVRDVDEALTSFGANDGPALRVGAQEP